MVQKASGAKPWVLGGLVEGDKSNLDGSCAVVVDGAHGTNIPGGVCGLRAIPRMPLCLPCLLVVSACPRAVFEGLQPPAIGYHAHGALVRGSACGRSDLLSMRLTKSTGQNTGQLKGKHVPWSLIAMTPGATNRPCVLCTDHQLGHGQEDDEGQEAAQASAHGRHELAHCSVTIASCICRLTAHMT